MLSLKIMYAANIIVAGWISISSLFFPQTALSTVFTNAIDYSESIRLVGALWAGVFLLSILGIFYPEKMRIIFLFQLIYKGLWLLVVALPAIRQGSAYPKSMALFFLIWVIVLPFIIPWKSIFVN